MKDEQTGFPSSFPAHCSARLRTRFGHPIHDVSGNPTALWAGDKITALRRSGTRALCLVEWGRDCHDMPHNLLAGVPKRLLRFGRPNNY